MAVKYAGKNGLIYMSTTGTARPSCAGGMRSFTIDNSTRRDRYHRVRRQ